VPCTILPLLISSYATSISGGFINQPMYVPIKPWEEFSLMAPLAFPHVSTGADCRLPELYPRNNSPSHEAGARNSLMPFVAWVPDTMRCRWRRKYFPQERCTAPISLGITFRETQQSMRPEPQWLHRDTRRKF
jgi:hypothetical protein